MSATTLGTARSRAATRKTSLHSQRLWALWGSYAALSVFVVMFLVPPFYTVITSLKSSAEISDPVGNPWIVHHPTLENFIWLVTYPAVGYAAAKWGAPVTFTFAGLLCS